MNLFFAIVFSLAGAVVIAIAAAWLLAPRLNVGTETTPPADLTRLALTIAAGVGGVVALVVAYRRQRDLEQGRFVEGFGAAAKQLGDADVAVRMAGVYAMAGVADQASKLKRQQCIDVLCGYLRLPYSPELGNNHQSGRTIKKPLFRKGGPEEELRFQYRQNDKEVRQTIVRVITGHLQEKSVRSWSSNIFDFTGSHFEEAYFFEAIFNGYVTFQGATFSGKKTSFQRAIFSGEITSFNGATFSGPTWFYGATFSSDNTWFTSAALSGSTGFDRATFSGDNTSFDGATFSGDNTSFDGATFSGKHTSFKEVNFGVGKVSFERPKVWNPPPAFDWDPGRDKPTPKPANVEPQDWPPIVRPSD
ncbi:pentapeptide repeat-containing protein [Pseudarthrobacter sulfonivorans]|uniref:pentapeptide repeat-containing protein n=1 Tax=Pseudarthrobacter sulfonivorans TaxID=121292 RepID=UPI001CC313A3|nr:pentapeptide repeat-containing protein [Pseudarthrobacter sulfonivorans]